MVLVSIAIERTVGVLTLSTLAAVVLEQRVVNCFCFGECLGCNFYCIDLVFHYLVSKLPTQKKFAVLNSLSFLWLETLWHYDGRWNYNPICCMIRFNPIDASIAVTKFGPILLAPGRALDIRRAPRGLPTVDPSLIGLPHDVRWQRSRLKCQNRIANRMVRGIL